MGQAPSCYGIGGDMGSSAEPQSQSAEPSTSSAINQAEPQSTAQHQPSTSTSQAGLTTTITTNQGPSTSTAGNFYIDYAGYRRDPAKYGPVVFSHRQLEVATNNFALDLLVGQGGFGPVYKGVLETGQTVAIKQLDPHSKQGHREFQAEVLMLSKVRHPNIINMIGYCTVGNRTRLIVYEFMSLGSLEFHLHNRVSPLDWNTRIRIAIGTAKALRFLHQDAYPHVIYRDLKSSNILLGDGHHPKLSDFGLSEIGPENERSLVHTDIMGTEGYCAPEYASTGNLKYVADIYSFGVVLLELITGQPPLDTEGVKSLVDWTRIRLTDGMEDNVVDPALRGEVSVHRIRRAVKLAVECARDNPEMRPGWTQVLNILERDLIIKSSSPLARKGKGLLQIQE